MFLDCRFSSDIWLQSDFTSHDFFSEGIAHNWIKNNVATTCSFLFFSGLWWTWRHRNLMCPSQETWTLPRITFQIHITADILAETFRPVPIQQTDITMRWNNNNCNCTVLNVDGSCLGSPIRAAYGGIFRNSAGLYTSGFSGFIATTTDIFFAELTAIHKCMLLVVEKGIETMVCYSDSLLSIKLLTDHASRYHAYAVLIHDIKDLLSSRNFSIHHCLREGNQSADFLAKLGATSNEEFSIRSTPHPNLLPLIRLDAMGTAFPRA